LVGLIFFRIGKNHREFIDIYEQIFLIILVYFLISLFISIPFYFSDYNLSFINSYFESVSGLTGTGFSVIKDINSLDSPLVLWRSSSQWIGGFYFLIFLVLIFSNKQINLKLIDFSFNLEKQINFSSNLINVASRIFLIYLALTISIFFIFSISGIRLLDTLHLTMTVISSGGFLPSNSLNEIITNDFQSTSLCIAFLISILNFYLFYNIFLKRENLRYHTEDFYIILFIVIFSSIFYFTNNLSLSSVFVNVLSSIGTSGISTRAVPENFGLYFIVLTLFGGSIISTTSGLKIFRIYILIKSFFMEMHKLAKPNVVINNKVMFSEKKVNTDDIRMSFLVFILFFLSLFLLSSILLVDFLDFENSFKLSILTLTNTVASDIYGMEKIQFSNLFTFSKVSLIMFMIIAKVELLAIFILVRKMFFKS
tara:strand:+ start:5569 stop:6840 length:1272 start_codon:yes stop_codon:yes gene_type:complete